MANLAELKKALIRDEDKRNYPYECSAGKVTIGIGHNLTDNGISDKVIDILYEEQIAKLLTDSRIQDIIVNLNEPRAEVILNMAFNLGVSGLLKFKRTLTHIKSGWWASAAEEMLDSKWARQVGPRAERLAAQIKTGVRY